MNEKKNTPNPYMSIASFFNDFFKLLKVEIYALFNKKKKDEKKA